MNFFLHLSHCFFFPHCEVLCLFCFLIFIKLPGGHRNIIQLWVIHSGMLDKNFCHGCYRADINLKYFLKYVVTDFKLVWNEDKIDLKNVVDFFFH